MHLSVDLEYIDRHRHRVVMVVGNAVSGDGRVIKTAQTVHKMGYDLTLFGMNSGTEQEPLVGFPFEVILLPNPKFEMLATRRWPRETDRIDWDIFWDIFARDLAEHLRQIKPDIFHTHDMLGLTFGPKLKARLKNTKFYWIHDIHEYVRGIDNLSPQVRDYYYAVEKKFIKDPDALTCVSPALAKLLKQELDLPKEPDLILNAPRLSDYDQYYPTDIRQASGLERGVPLLVYSGSLTKVRGVDSIIDALPRIKDAHLAIITNQKGPYLDELKAHIKRLSLSERVHFHSYVPFMNVTSFLRGADLGIHPIYRYSNASISLPNKLFEYIHAGLPLVVSDNPAMAKFVRQHDTGLVFKAGDHRSLAGAVNQALSAIRENPGWPQEIQALAPQYNWEKQEEVLAGIYRLARQKIKKQSPATSNAFPHRVLHLPVPGAGQPRAFVAALRVKGLRAANLMIGGHRFQYDCDLKLREAEDEGVTLTEFARAASDYDVFHYHRRPVFHAVKQGGFQRGLDMLMLRSAGKKVFYHYRGSEMRLPSIFKKADPYNYVEEVPDLFREMLSEDRQVAYRDFVGAVCNGVFVVDPELQTYVPHSLIVPRVIDTQKWTPAYSEAQGELQVVHAPSNRLFKGTDALIAAIRRLEREGHAVKLTLVERLSHEQAMEVYRRADIVVDQLRIGWYGVLAVEAMALGKAVVSFIRDDLKHFLPQPMPLAVANPDNIYQVLAGLLADRESLRQLGRRGRAYVEEHHDAAKISETLLYLYQTVDKPFDMSAAATWMTMKPGAKKKKAVAAGRRIPLRQWLLLTARAYCDRFIQTGLDEGWAVALRKAGKKILKNGKRLIFPKAA